MKGGSLMVLSKLKTYGDLVMFSHTLFSLPFALIALLLAANGLPATPIIFWSMVALFAGRNGANALNRWVDKDIDANNPRTSHRHLPSGAVKPYEALGLTAICYVIFVYAAYRINPLCFYLSPIALGLFTLYSYTKRFTWLCHIILGITCAGAPVGAWLAVTGAFHIVPLMIGSVVALWVAGFDIIYGTQDIDFDRENNLFSIPAAFGLKHALWIARGLHLVMWIILMALVVVTSLGWVYVIGVLISGGLLLMEHYIVDPAHRHKMNVASYHLNQVISVLLLSVTVVDIFYV